MSTQASQSSSDIEAPLYRKTYRVSFAVLVFGLVTILVALGVVVHKYETALATATSEAARLRGELKVACADRNEHNKTLAARTDELSGAIGERDRITKLYHDLIVQEEKDNRRFSYTSLLEDMEGMVTAAPRADVVEISVGSDDGVRKGQKLEVVRLSTHSYVGRIEVVELSGNRAVCRPDQSMSRSAIQKGDHVYASLSKFK